MRGDHLIHWIGLSLVFSERLGAQQKIVRAFDSIEAAFGASRADLVSLGIGKKEAEELLSPRTLEMARREIERLRGLGYEAVCLDDDDYPPLLREIYDPPVVLSCMGEKKGLNAPAVAMVGSRRPTAYGRAVAEKLAADLAERGVVLVSGLARGIDTAVHWGAVRAGSTVAVLGSGLDRIYPRENRKLAETIARSGAVISEFPMGAKPLGHHFPRRNRIISGLSLAVVVVEAARPSGSLITAKLALEQNREVLAVPGNITSEFSRGTNWLIKTGAGLVSTWQDVVEELPAPWNRDLMEGGGEESEPVESLGDRERAVFDLLLPDALVHVDELVEKSGLSVTEVLTTLLSLEIKGRIVQRPGQYFQRKL